LFLKIKIFFCVKKLGRKKWLNEIPKIKFLSIENVHHIFLTKTKNETIKNVIQ